MIDFHTHVLPAIDDGSKSVEQSLSMLRMMQRQGVDIVAATPHYNANRRSVREFLERRQQSFARLEAGLLAGMPAVKLGAEVQYYEGISRLADIEALKIQDSQLLLLEMPTEKWSDHTIRELLHMSASGSQRIVIAHIERCEDCGNARLMDQLVANGVLFQSNASRFLRFLPKLQAFSALKKNRLHLIGSDCHNTTSRPPCLGAAYDVIARKFGQDMVSQMDDYAHSLFHNK